MFLDIVIPREELIMLNENKNVLTAVFGGISEDYFKKILDNLSGEALSIYRHMVILGTKYPTYKKFKEWVKTHSNEFDAFHWKCIKAEERLDCYDNRDEYVIISSIDAFLWDIEEETYLWDVLEEEEDKKGLSFK